MPSPTPEQPMPVPSPFPVLQQLARDRQEAAMAHAVARRQRKILRRRATAERAGQALPARVERRATWHVGLPGR